MLWSNKTDQRQCRMSHAFQCHHSFIQTDFEQRRRRRRKTDRSCASLPQIESSGRNKSHRNQNKTFFFLWILHRKNTRFSALTRIAASRSRVDVTSAVERKTQTKNAFLFISRDSRCLWPTLDYDVFFLQFVVQSMASENAHERSESNNILLFSFWINCHSIGCFMFDRLVENQWNDHETNVRASLSLIWRMNMCFVFCFSAPIKM